MRKQSDTSGASNEIRTNLLAKPSIKMAHKPVSRQNSEPVQQPVGFASKKLSATPNISFTNKLNESEISEVAKKSKGSQKSVIRVRKINKPNRKTTYTYAPSQNQPSEKRNNPKSPTNIKQENKFSLRKQTGDSEMMNKSFFSQNEARDWSIVPDFRSGKNRELPNLKIKKGDTNFNIARPFKITSESNLLEQNSEKNEDSLKDISYIGSEELKQDDIDLDFIAEFHENELDDVLEGHSELEDDISKLIERHEELQQEISEAKHPVYVAKRETSTTYTIGDNREGTCGIDSTATFVKNLTPIQKRFEAINCGYYHVAAIDENEIAYTWGRNN